jgi:hypothetical protein
MIKSIKKIYPICDNNNCHENFSTSFYLHDQNNGKCIATINPNNSTCFIEKDKATTIDFVAIDDCLIGIDSMKCDALVTVGKILWFIELKEVQWSHDSNLNRTKRRNARKKGVIQIAETINHFKANGINFKDCIVAGLISFPPFSSPNPTTVPSTSSQARVLEFTQLCGYTELYEGNHIVL